MRLIVNLALALLGGCASEFTKVAPQPPGKYERLGQASGSACGSILIGPTAANFIPVLLNDRTERAYQNALQSVPGATGIINVTMQEDWYWYLIGSAKCVTISGEAVR